MRKFCETRKLKDVCEVPKPENKKKVKPACLSTSRCGDHEYTTLPFFAGNNAQFIVQYALQTGLLSAVPRSDPTSSEILQKGFMEEPNNLGD